MPIIFNNDVLSLFIRNNAFNFLIHKQSWFLLISSIFIYDMLKKKTFLKEILRAMTTSCKK